MPAPLRISPAHVVGSVAPKCSDQGNSYDVSRKNGTDSPARIPYGRLSASPAREADGGSLRASSPPGDLRSRA